MPRGPRWCVDDLPHFVGDRLPLEPLLGDRLAGHHAAALPRAIADRRQLLGEKLPPVAGDRIRVTPAGKFAVLAAHHLE